MKQRDKVLGMLREAGLHGVHTFELRARYIGNPSQRISELEEAGHHIAHRRERLAGQAVGTRYTLLRDAERGVTEAAPQTTASDGQDPIPGGTTPESATPQLFDPTPGPVSPYEEDKAA